MSSTVDGQDPIERARGIAAAIDAIVSGQLVVLPTDTLYGIGADAFSRPAVAALLGAKGRGRDMPVPAARRAWLPAPEWHRGGSG